MSIEDDGNHQLIKRLAMGGMAQIFLARQRRPRAWMDVVVKPHIHHKVIVKL